MNIENVLQSKLLENYKKCLSKILQLETNEDYSDKYKNDEMFQIVQKTQILNYNIIADYRNNRFSTSS